MKSITDLIIMFIKLFIVYKAALFGTRVISNLSKKGLKFVLKKAKKKLTHIQFLCQIKATKLYFACKKAIKARRLNADEPNTKPEQN